MMQQMLVGFKGSGSQFPPLPGYDVNKAGSYLMVPFRGPSNQNDLLFIDSNTGKVEERIVNIGYGGELYRFGTNILNLSYSSTWELWSALTLQKIATGTIASNFYSDGLKFASDKILTFGLTNTSGNSTSTAYTHSVSNSGLSQIASNTATNMGIRNSTYGLIQNPVIGGQASINSSTGILSSMGTIGTKAPNNGSSAHALRGSMTVNSSGTSIGFNGANNDPNNYSRPVAATGGNGNCLVSGMDGSQVHIFSGNSHGSQISGNGLHSPPTTTFSPAAVLGSNAWLSVANIYSGSTPYPNCVVVTTGGTSSLFVVPNSTSSSVQSIPGGAAIVYVSGNDIKFRKYLSSGGLQSEVTVTDVPMTVSSSNAVNPGHAFKKIINY